MMSLESVKNYLKQFNKDQDIIVSDKDTSTVYNAALAIGVTEGEIAKTLTFKVKDEPIVIVLAGDLKVDNHKYKEFFHQKAAMLTHDEALEVTGHEVGGVCPFAIPEGVKIYCDVSLKKYAYVYPACGSQNSYIKLTPEEIYEISHSDSWIDIAKSNEESLGA